MWRVRREEAPGCYGPWAVVETGAAAVGMIEGREVAERFQVQRVFMTAEEWNALPEFGGW